jgi:hypothetical protein
MDNVEELGNLVFKLSQEQLNEELVKQQTQNENGTETEQQEPDEEMDQDEQLQQHDNSN